MTKTSCWRSLQSPRKGIQTNCWGFCSTVSCRHFQLCEWHEKSSGWQNRLRDEILQPFEIFPFSYPFWSSSALLFPLRICHSTSGAAHTHRWRFTGAVAVAVSCQMIFISNCYNFSSFGFPASLQFLSSSDVGCCSYYMENVKIHIFPWYIRFSASTVFHINFQVKKIFSILFLNFMLFEYIFLFFLQQQRTEDYRRESLSWMKHSFPASEQTAIQR